MDSPGPHPQHWAVAGALSGRAPRQAVLNGTGQHIPLTQRRALRRSAWVNVTREHGAVWFRGGGRDRKQKPHSFTYQIWEITEFKQSSAAGREPTLWLTMHKGHGCSDCEKITLAFFEKKLQTLAPLILCKSEPGRRGTREFPTKEKHCQGLHTLRLSC